MGWDGMGWDGMGWEGGRVSRAFGGDAGQSDDVRGHAAGGRDGDGGLHLVVGDQVDYLD